MLEYTIRKKCIEQLKKDGWKIFPLSDKFRSGYPDIICFKEGSEVLIREFKRSSGGKRSKLQIHFINMLTSFGFDAKFVSKVEELY
jgi:hypothetical protein